MDNGDGTITDLATGLMWEKKSDDGSIHDRDDEYTWTDQLDGDPTNPDGTAFTVFLATLNDHCDKDESVFCSASGDSDCAGVGGACGFAGYRDWRLPEVNRDGGAFELDSLIDEAQQDENMIFPALKSPCLEGCTVLDPECSCNKPFVYWSSTNVSVTYTAQVVVFSGGYVSGDQKMRALHVRAVRSAEEPLADR